MAPDEYTKALDKALSDLANRVQNRDLLNAEIAGLRETVRVLSSRVEMSTEKQRQIAQLLAMADSATPKVTDAIRTLLISAYPVEMTAIEVRNALEDSSNFDDFSNSLSACHAALKRMLNDGEVESGTPRDGKASYRWVLKLEPPSYFSEAGGFMAVGPTSAASNLATALLAHRTRGSALEDAITKAKQKSAMPPPPESEDHPLRKLATAPRPPNWGKK
jgi:hypothetical protein